MSSNEQENEFEETEFGVYFIWIEDDASDEYDFRLEGYNREEAKEEAQFLLQLHKEGATSHLYSAESDEYIASYERVTIEGELTVVEIEDIEYEDTEAA